MNLIVASFKEKPITMSILTLLFLLSFLIATDFFGYFIKIKGKYGEAFLEIESGEQAKQPTLPSKEYVEYPIFDGINYTHYRTRLKKIPVIIIDDSNIDSIRLKWHQNYFMPTNCRIKIGNYVQYSLADKQFQVRCPVGETNGEKFEAIK